MGYFGNEYQTFPKFTDDMCELGEDEISVDELIHADKNDDLVAVIAQEFMSDDDEVEQTCFRVWSMSGDEVDNYMRSGGVWYYLPAADFLEAIKATQE